MQELTDNPPFRLWFSDTSSDKELVIRSLNGGLALLACPGPSCSAVTASSWGWEVFYVRGDFLLSNRWVVVVPLGFSGMCREGKEREARRERRCWLYGHSWSFFLASALC